MANTLVCALHLCFGSASTLHEIYKVRLLPWQTSVFFFFFFFFFFSMQVDHSIKTVDPLIPRQRAATDMTGACQDAGCRMQD